MARKSIHLQAAGALQPRERIWAQIRRLKTFTAGDIEDRTGIPATTIRTYLEALAAGGIIAGAGGGKRAAQGLFGRRAWRLVRDCGIDAPRLTRGGRESMQGRSALQMWRAMRVLPEFDRAALAHAASTEQHPVLWHTAQRYIDGLRKSGHVRIVSPSRGRQRATYTLAHYTGPKPPTETVQRVVWDPNLGRVIDSEEAWK